ncbi:glycosyltransferase, group 1 family protein [Sphingobacterium spiritivorum ATCC 33300]|uniref:Glycosyltransferase, group 1 family protein n=1 Tax=Sphingobacterium spiritivorum ATCC 33300 TaxID=525372 RepID=C2FYX0_SPHSI|nr:glycosyltransferase family 4 protein [Sphingobacterium spiritivorum]EEI91812.1 glycosyltransferase, group 1 family protein [Sphingobacterium spiritivorum ATCC 33300]QQS97037.1 glycosyltransferase family 4 protein [Sphingobacterium spiritivorum]
MEVLFVSHKYPPGTGGMQKQSYELITGMYRHCTVHQIVYEGEEHILYFFLRLQLRILQKCRKYPSISVIHFNDGLLAAFCLLHRKYPHLKKSLTLHGLDVVFPNKLFQKKILPKFNRYHQFIAVSQATATAAINRGLDAKKMLVIANGVDDRPPVAPLLTVESGTKNIPTYIIALGRPVKRKGFSWFIEEVLPHLHQSIELIIVGPFQKKKPLLESILAVLPKNLSEQILLFLGYPSDESAIRKLSMEGSNTRRFRHLGKLPAIELQQYLNRSLAFVMPNIPIAGDMEGFGLVCLEACQAGTLVLAADIDGIPQAIQHQKNGWLLPAKDADAWILEINSLHRNSKKRDQMIPLFQTFTSQNYGWDIMVQHYFQAFQSLDSTAT